MPCLLGEPLYGEEGWERDVLFRNGDCAGLRTELKPGLPLPLLFGNRELDSENRFEDFDAWYISGEARC